MSFKVASSKKGRNFGAVVDAVDEIICFWGDGARGNGVGPWLKKELVGSEGGESLNLAVTYKCQVQKHVM